MRGVRWTRRRPHPSEVVILTGGDGTLYERGRSLACRHTTSTATLRRAAGPLRLSSVPSPLSAARRLWLRFPRAGRSRRDQARATVARDQSEFGLRSDAFLTRS